MKLLFLDIDGVMTSNDLVRTKSSSGLLYPFSKSCVEALNEILRNNKPKIILTSSWRNVFNVAKQCQIFRENRVIQMPFGATIDLGYENRALEIAHFLKNKKVSEFVILDDMELAGFEGHFIKINPAEGLTRFHVLSVNKILNST